MKKSETRLAMGNRLWFFVPIFFIFPQFLFAQKDYYTPKSLLIPLHDAKNQLHASLGRGGGFDLNVSYAFTNRLALFSAATLDIGNKKRSTIMGSKYNIEKNDYSLKGGIGYYTKSNKRLFGILEAYLGVGLSKVDNSWYFIDYGEGVEYTQARYLNVFGQINAGKKRLKSDYAIALRVGYANYTDFDFFYDHPNFRYIQSRYEGVHGLSADPVISYSYCLGKIKLNAQAGLAVPVSKSSATKIDRYTMYDGTSQIVDEVRSEENVYLGTVLGRLSVQYTFDFIKKNR